MKTIQKNLRLKKNYQAPLQPQNPNALKKFVIERRKMRPLRRYIIGQNQSNRKKKRKKKQKAETTRSITTL